MQLQGLAPFLKGLKGESGNTGTGLPPTPKGDIRLTRSAGRVLPPFCKGETAINQQKHKRRKPKPQTATNCKQLQLPQTQPSSCCLEPYHYHQASNTTETKQASKWWLVWVSFHAKDCTQARSLPPFFPSQQDPPDVVFTSIPRTTKPCSHPGGRVEPTGEAEKICESSSNESDMNYEILSCVDDGIRNSWLLRILILTR